MIRFSYKFRLRQLTHPDFVSLPLTEGSFIRSRDLKKRATPAFPR